MNNVYHSKQIPRKSRMEGLGKWIAILGGIGVLVLLIVIIILGGYIYITANAATQSEISFRAPQDGERIEAGQPIQVRVMARDEKKIVRLELRVDGQLIETQTSNTPGGINPFPLLTTWNPTSGTHTLIARSVNSRKGTSQTTITVEVVALADRDKDGIGDESDACPDVPGIASAEGCPDRDFDGIADERDACPDAAGIPEDGCPASTEGDRDGDGTLDTADTCPDEVGSPLAGGCPDTDNDGIGNTSDACPSEPGGGDGCPDTGGDAGFRGDDGPGDDTGGDDTGGDDTGGDDTGGDDSVSGEHESFGEGGGWEAIDLVRLEALNFSVTRDYDEIYCYAGVVGRDMNHYGPFNSLGHHEWDIVEYMGGENTRTLGVEVGESLNLRVECTGNIGDSDSFNLGSFEQTYDSSQWDGHVIEEISGATSDERGDPGHSFRVKFRLCLRTCDSADFPPPSLRLHEVRVGPFTNHYLDWNWVGDRDNITGYHLYVNGHRRETIRNADANRINQREYLPPCGERYEYTLTAYQMDGVILRESPPSNSVYSTGEECPRRVKVTFEELGVSGLHTIGSDMLGGRGPLYGTFWASGNEIQSLRFDGGDCVSVLWVFHCGGFKIQNGSITIPRMFDEMRAFHESCPGFDCREAFAPSVNYIIVELDEGDDLSFGGNILDEEAFGSDESLFEDRNTIGASESLPREVTLEDENSRGRFTLRVRIEEMSEH